jgi:hypothetical protein
MRSFINTFIYKFPQNDLFDKVENWIRLAIPFLVVHNYESVQKYQFRGTIPNISSHSAR